MEMILELNPSFNGRKRTSKTVRGSAWHSLKRLEKETRKRSNGYSLRERRTLICGAGWEWSYRIDSGHRYTTFLVEYYNPLEFHGVG